jgi:type VI secretion system secreted protein Hcp
MGKTLPKGKLEFRRADGDGKPIKYYKVELENVIISHMDQIVHEGMILHDSIGIRFSKVKWKYTQQNIGAAPVATRLSAGISLATSASKGA